MKLLDISRLDITAQALIQYNINGKSLKNKKIVHLSFNDIEGIVLGAGENARFIVCGGGILGALIAAILIGAW